MKTLNSIILLGLTGAISPITYNLLHKRNAEDSDDNLRVLLTESQSDREVVEVPVMEYEDDNKPSKDEEYLMIMIIREDVKIQRFSSSRNVFVFLFLPLPIKVLTYLFY